MTKLDPNLCKQRYQVQDVKKILEFNEGPPPANAATTTREVVHSINGPMTITINSENKTGHAMERHLLITENGLQERVKSLPLASAFMTDKLNNLTFCLTQLLNSDRGQQALGYLDYYREHGKTRVVITETAKVLRCTQIKARVFYQGENRQKCEPLVGVTAVLDSNFGGGFPIRVVTCFPSQDDASVSISIADVMAQARDKSAELNTAIGQQNQWAGSASNELKLADRALKWATKSYKNIPMDLVPHTSKFIGFGLMLGTPFNESWFRPHSPFYNYQHPPSTVDVAMGEAVSYAKLAAALPVPKLLHRGVFEAAMEGRGKKVEEHNGILICRL